MAHAGRLHAQVLEVAGSVSLRDQAEDDIVDDDGALVLVEEPPVRPLVDHNTVLHPGQDIPTTADGPQYTERDLYVSEETAAVLQETDPTDSGPMRAFKAWCAKGGRIAVPCTTRHVHRVQSASDGAGPQGLHHQELHVADQHGYAAGKAAG